MTESAENRISVECRGRLWESIIRRFLACGCRAGQSGALAPGCPRPVRPVLRGQKSRPCQSGPVRTLEVTPPESPGSPRRKNEEKASMAMDLRRSKIRPFSRRKSPLRSASNRHTRTIRIHRKLLKRLGRLLLRSTQIPSGEFSIRIRVRRAAQAAFPVAISLQQRRFTRAWSAVLPLFPESPSHVELRPMGWRALWQDKRRNSLAKEE